MGILIKILAIIGAFAIIVVIVATWKFRSMLKKSYGEVAKEYATLETADWFGTTGLDEETERELSRYLRREFGERLSESDSLKAADLVYLGVFQENDHQVHYWRIPNKDAQTEPYFAHIIVSTDGSTCTSWGDKTPPNGGA